MKKVYIVNCRSMDGEETQEAFATRELALDHITNHIIPNDFEGMVAYQSGEGFWWVFSNAYENDPIQDVIDNGDWAWQIELNQVTVKE